LLAAMDELFKDYLRHHPHHAHVADLTVQRVFEWAVSQAEAPTRPPDGGPHHNGCVFDEPD
jgi:hypothetical protein